MLDLSQWLAGPVAATMLAEFGADVIMVELPEAGPRQERPGERNLSFIVTNRNKRSVALDVRAEEGRAAFLDLVRVSDVVVENFRPGTLERWGLGPDVLLAVNHRLVLLRASGFGQTGPNAPRSTFNPVGLAFGGLTYLNGWPDRPPLRDGVTAGDYTTALFGLLGTLAALVRRDRDGEGQVVDVAMYAAVLRMTGDMLAVRSALGIRRERAGGAWPVYPVALTLPAADGHWVTASLPEWQDVFAAVARLGLGEPATEDEARGRLAAFVAPMPAAAAVASARAAGLPASVVNSVADIAAEPHIWSRQNLVRLHDERLGEVITQGVVPALSATPGRLTSWSPYVGSDNEAVLGGILGYAPEQIERLTAKTRVAAG